MGCKSHPRYRGLVKPRSSCEGCWAFWFGLAEVCINNCCQEKERELVRKFGDYG